MLKPLKSYYFHSILTQLPGLTGGPSIKIANKFLLTFMLRRLGKQKFFFVKWIYDHHRRIHSSLTLFYLLKQ